MPTVLARPTFQLPFSVRDLGDHPEAARHSVLQATADSRALRDPTTKRLREARQSVPPPASAPHAPPQAQEEGPANLLLPRRPCSPLARLQTGAVGTCSWPAGHAPWTPCPE